MKTPVFKHKGQYEGELEWYEKGFFENEFKAMCYTKVLDLNVSFAYSDEPTPFSEKSSLVFKPIKVGDVWAEKNFACAWFHLEGKLPVDIDRKGLYLDFFNGGEGLLVDKNGSALKGFTAGSPAWGALGYTVEKRYYPIDDLADSEGNIDLYIDGASNCFLGEFIQNAVLSSACVMRRNEQLFDLYYDFDVLLNYTATLEGGSERKYQFVYALRDVMNLIVYHDPDFYSKAKKITKSLFESGEEDKIVTTAIGHAHMDLAWLWPIRETKRKILRYFSNVIYLFEKYPDFRFSLSQPQQLEWVKELDPVLYEKIKRYVKEGRIELVGGGWVENDTNMPCGESLVRQELYGQKFWQEEFGGYVNIRWLPDTFGYSAALPQIIKKSKQDYFMTIKISWSNRTIFPYHFFHWEGIDGSAVLSHMPPEGTYNAMLDPQGLLNAERALLEDDPKDEFLTVYGIGDGGGGPSITMMERALREKNTPYLPKVQQTPVKDFYDRLKDKQLPTYAGEMYLEKHRGTYTSQSDNKKFNREAESKMLHLEKLIACSGATEDKQQTDNLWKEILLYQFHDILPGSSIKRVYDETSVAYKRIFADQENIANGLGYTFIADRDKPLVNIDNREVTKLVKPKDDIWLYYKGAEKSILPTVYERGDVAGAIHFVETDDYKINIADDGSFSDICLKDGRTIFNQSNRLRVFIDRGDAWDFEDDYRNQPEMYMKLINSFVRDFGDLIEIRQTYSFKSSRIIQKVLIHKHDPLICIYHDVDWNETGYMVRAEFLPAVWSDTVHSDIQFGYLDRPTTDNTEHERAQFEICCNKWFDISEENCGFSIVNNTKCGFMAKQGIVSVNLFRATNYPCEKAEIHQFSYSYAIYPHSGGFDPVKVDDIAEDFNACNLFGGKGVETPSSDTPSVVISSVKAAYDKNGYILRAFERTGEKATANIRLPKGYSFVCETDLLEDKIGEVPETFTFSPFEIRTFRIKREK